MSAQVTTEIYTIERHGIDSYILKKTIPEEKYTVAREFWYCAKDDRWYNHNAIGCVFMNLDDCKFYYEKFISLAGKNILFTTTIKEKTIRGALIALIEKLIERL